ncbi:hypothetical protein J437_LFUL003060 [Ladona fulva]|uniref:STAGA complex 65 subunit gamma n=1 Tax=Ladona fulva TaxID=123851 RepID=A0A8K0K174_LADFU|nr:hypothetical protein J437_LFUL003060 [Ladona fulva]
MDVPKYWGEYESLCDNSEDEVTFEELDTHVDHEPVTEDKLKLYLPYDEEEYGELVQVPEEYVEMDGMVVHTIKLLQHSRAMKELLNNANAMLQNGNEEVKALPEPPLLPDGPKKGPKYSLNYPFRYMEKETSDFGEGEGSPPVLLSPLLTRKVLRKVVATLLAHIGFETTTESVLEFLCDICHEYMQKMTRLMRIAADREVMTGSTGFPDIMERVFHEMGIGSVCTLHSFYQSRVIMYHARMKHTCQQLDEEYQLLRRSLSKEEDGPIRTQTSEHDEEVINVSDSPSHSNQETNTSAADIAQSGTSGQTKPRKRKRKNNS